MIEAAQVKSGKEPADEFIAGILKNKSRPKNRKILIAMALVFEEYSHTGTVRTPLELRQLRSDLWELKADCVRFPFYVAPQHVSIEAARLTGGFEKKSEKTPRREIDNGLWVMEQDRHYG